MDYKNYIPGIMPDMTLDGVYNDKYTVQSKSLVKEQSLSGQAQLVLRPPLKVASLPIRHPLSKDNGSRLLNEQNKFYEMKDAPIVNLINNKDNNPIFIDFKIRLVDIKGRVSEKMIAGNSEQDDFGKFREVVSSISNINIGNLILVSERPADNSNYGLMNFPAVVYPLSKARPPIEGRMSSTSNGIYSSLLAESTASLSNDVTNILVINNTINQNYNKPVNIKFENGEFGSVGRMTNLDIVRSIDIDSSWTISRLKNEILSRGLIDGASIVYHVNNSESNIHTDFVLPDQLYVGAIPFDLFNFKILTSSNL